MLRRVTSFFAVALLAALLTAAPASSPSGGATASSRPALTFLVWSDQHVTYDGDASLLTAPVDAMNAIAGRAYPDRFGGTVDRPQFVLGAGDCTDWPTRAAVNAYESATDRLRYPHYDVIGNHDEGGDDGTLIIIPMIVAVCAGAIAYPAARLLGRGRRWGGVGRAVVFGLLVALIAGLGTVGWEQSQRHLMFKWITRRHGGLNYTFDCGGVHFIAIYSAFNPKVRITPEALGFIRNDLARLPKNTPVIIATHYCYAAIDNKDEFCDAMGNANVILVIGGHFHHGSVASYRGRNFLGAWSPTMAPLFTVVRIMPGRLQTIQFDYKAGRWAEKDVIDVPLSTD